MGYRYDDMGTSLKIIDKDNVVIAQEYIENKVVISIIEVNEDVAQQNMYSELNYRTVVKKVFTLHTFRILTTIKTFCTLNMLLHRLIWIIL